MMCRGRSKKMQNKTGYLVENEGTLKTCEAMSNYCLLLLGVLTA